MNPGHYRLLWRHDAAARRALQSANLRWRAILHYVWESDSFRNFGSIIGALLRSQLGNLSRLVSIGRIRKRFPVAAKIALVTAGTIAEVPGSPIPPGGSEFWMMWTSMAGASFMRSIW